MFCGKKGDLYGDIDIFIGDGWNPDNFRGVCTHWDDFMRPDKPSLTFFAAQVVVKRG